MPKKVDMHYAQGPVFIPCFDSEPNYFGAYYETSEEELQALQEGMESFCRWQKLVWKVSCRERLRDADFVKNQAQEERDANWLQGYVESLRRGSGMP